MEQKKRVLAQLFAEALDSYSAEPVMDAIWLLNDGLGDIEDQWENFLNLFQKIFGISYEEAQNLELF